MRSPVQPIPSQPQFPVDAHDAPARSSVQPRKRRGAGSRTIRGLIFAALLVVAGWSQRPTAVAARGPAAAPDSVPAPALVEALGPRASSLRPEVLRLALGAHDCAAQQGLVNDPRLLTVIDYSLPSTEPRLWVLDLRSQRVLYSELVAHGKNTGENLAARFSNRPGSLQSSLGLFVTEDTYVGRNGYSLRLRGLEPGVNDLAYERAIVMHGASYVSAAAARTLGRLGRSWGCPALSAAIAREVIDFIKGGSAVFAYYPDADWLDASRFAGRCVASR